MSFKALNWQRELKLRGSQKPVLGVLAAYADEEGSCYPGQELIADDSGFSVRTVRRCLEALEQQGLIRTEHRYDRRGHRTSDRYYLQLDVVTLPDPDEPAADVEAAPTDPEPDRPAATSPLVHFGTPATATQPVDNSPTGQNDRRSSCPSLPANLSIPTGQNGRYIDEPSGDPSEEPSGGASAAPLSPTCGKHPAGTTAPCRACGDARRRWDAYRATPPPPPAAPARSKRWRPGLCEPHLQRADTCDACRQDARQLLVALCEPHLRDADTCQPCADDARRTLEQQFGVPA